MKQKAGAVQHFSFTEPFPPLEGEGGPIDLKGPVSAEGEAYNSGSSVVVRGAAQARAALTCSRCGKLFEQPVEATLQVEYVPGRVEDGPIDEDEGPERAPYEGDEVDLKDEVRQQLLLALPMKPLCSTDCKGLCPICGKDHNEGPCECKPQVDVRLAGLADFFKQPAETNPDGRGGGNDGPAKKKDLPR
ncbi:MAG: YceD family protein [Bacillota bacterium]